MAKSDFEENMNTENSIYEYTELINIKIEPIDVITCDRNHVRFILTVENKYTQCTAD